jgi:hypothetical protein
MPRNVGSRPHAAPSRVALVADLPQCRRFETGTTHGVIMKIPRVLISSMYKVYLNELREVYSGWKVVVDEVIDQLSSTEAWACVTSTEQFLSEGCPCDRLREPN